MKHVRQADQEADDAGEEIDLPAAEIDGEQDQEREPDGGPEVEVVVERQPSARPAATIRPSEGCRTAL